MVAVGQSRPAEGRLDRATRLEQAKAIGRVAYRLVREAKIEGYIEIERGRFLLRDWECGFLSINLYAAANRDLCEEDFSELRVRYAGRKVLDIRWNDAGSFRVVVFDRGEWEQELRS